MLLSVSVSTLSTLQAIPTWGGPVATGNERVCSITGNVTAMLLLTEVPGVLVSITSSLELGNCTLDCSSRPPTVVAVVEVDGITLGCVSRMNLKSEIHEFYST